MIHPKDGGQVGKTILQYEIVEQIGEARLTDLKKRIEEII